MKVALDPTEVCTSCTNFSFLGEHGKARAVASRAANSIFPEPHRGLLEPFGGQGLKVLKMSLLGASWDHLAAKAPKCSYQGQDIGRATVHFGFKTCRSGAFCLKVVTSIPGWTSHCAFWLEEV